MAVEVDADALGVSGARRHRVQAAPDGYAAAMATPEPGGIKQSAWPKAEDLITVNRGGMAAPYKVTDVQHKEGSGIWTYTLEPMLPGRTD